MGSFYRLCRLVHGYLSAFAFLALMFFAFTGLTLNHPDWLGGRKPPEQTRTVKIPMAEIAAALKAQRPEAALADAAGRATPLAGVYASGETVDGQALLRFQGPSGVSDVTITLATGETEAVVQRATTIARLNDLHKGKAAGGVWRLAIDVSAILVLLLSLVGYILFFSLRFRLKTSLALTGVSLIALVALALAFGG